MFSYALVAQLDRASGYGPEGWGFEFLRARNYFGSYMENHSKWMEFALEEARKALEKKEVPIGAVVVHEGRIIGRGHNLVETLQDPTAHAEILAITAASNYLASWRQEESVLYSTLEPCSMCAGAVLLARIPLVVYGASDPRFGACGSAIQVAHSDNLDVKTRLVKGVLETQCSHIIKTFFNELRNH